MTTRRADGATSVRRARVTVLLVGEGHAEVGFLRHLHGLLVTRRGGVAVTIKNARGKGAAHVVNFAIRQSRNAQYDRKLALLDTDTDWSPKVQALARRHGVDVVPCAPCLEALLLRLCVQPVTGKSTAQLKRAFKQHAGCDASDERLDWTALWPVAALERLRADVTELDTLMRAFAAKAQIRVREAVDSKR